MFIYLFWLRCFVSTTPISYWCLKIQCSLCQALLLSSKGCNGHMLLEPSRANITWGLSRKNYSRSGRVYSLGLTALKVLWPTIWKRGRGECSTYLQGQRDKDHPLTISGVQWGRLPLHCKAGCAHLFSAVPLWLHTPRLVLAMVRAFACWTLKSGNFLIFWWGWGATLLAYSCKYVIMEALRWGVCPC